MTDSTETPIRYRRTDAPGQIFGVPNTDLTEADWERVTPDLRREVKASPLYKAAPQPKATGETKKAGE